MGFNPLDIFGGGGGGGGDAALLAFLAFQREQQEKLELEGERAEEFAETLTEFRRRQLSSRGGFAGSVNVGPAVIDTQARLARRMALLAADDPTRIAFEEARAERAQEASLSRRILSGEEFEIEDQIRDFQTSLDKFSGLRGDVTGLQELLNEINAFGKERAGRHAEREDLIKLLADAKGKLQKAKVAFPVRGGKGVDPDAR